MAMIRNYAALTCLPCALLLCLSPPLAAQDGSPALASVDQLSFAPVTPVSAEVLPLGGLGRATLRLEQSVSSASAHRGDRIRFTLENDLYVANRGEVASAGTSVYATVAHVRPKTHQRSGNLQFSDPEIVLSNGKRIRLTKTDPQDRFGVGAIPVVIVAAVTLGPLVVVTSPISLTELLIHRIHERHVERLGQTTKPPPVEREFSEGDVVCYYANVGA